MSHRRPTRPAGEPHGEDVTALLGRVPGWADRARVVQTLEGGITNRNHLVEVDGERFVLRQPGHATELLGIDRAVERTATERAAVLGTGPEVVAVLEPEGALVTRFLDGRPVAPAEMATAERLGQVAATLRAFHGSGPLPGAFDCFAVPFAHRDTAVSLGVPIPDTWERLAASATEIAAVFAAGLPRTRPCHNDLLNANFLATAERLWLLDWEYAGNDEHSFDLGNFAAHHDLADGAVAAFVAAYYGTVTARALARVDLMRVVSDWREASWAYVQQGLSDLDFDYAAYAARHLDRALRRVSDPRYGESLSDAARAR